MAYDGFVHDDEGRELAGRAYLGLADDHVSHEAAMRGILDGESPVPYEEIAAPYYEFLSKLLQQGGEQAGELGFAGAGQVETARGNVALERSIADAFTPTDRDV
ncbi:hypothetical protein Misp01_82140 [Microtetraspora sp. NBRC 13810]|uniref:hypothetical protein n=1 Tax=Microtetraspora sp. NBRC 13810 TaxID=3030990 RepID=UPI0024A50DD4|nr:hypothetical protein [Microtetraspora sp. NBRC 13810]GLW13086.1 hypothetical protein Misp01_82140 [Microtetraspora sp. NBRC 13810]